MYSLIRPLLFCLEAEKAHHLALSALRIAPRWCFKKVPSYPVKVLGHYFSHPIGLAAGLDKNGDYLDALSKLGFSFIELGTVTPYPQVGNPKPRLFRLPQGKAIINRMGFNNKGVDALMANVENAQYSGVLGINIGKNKETPLDKAADDYRYCLKKIYSRASYVTINISSPNTKDLRMLQQEAFLSSLLQELNREQQRLADQYQRLVPLLVKISPDEPDDILKKIANTVVSQGYAGIIATNTTCARTQVAHYPNGQEIGGLSGEPLFERSTECLRLIKKEIGNTAVLIGAGGIDGPASAEAKLQAGADLLQVYSGLIYQGPDLLSHLVKGLQSSQRAS